MFERLLFHSFILHVGKLCGNTTTPWKGESSKFFAVHLRKCCIHIRQQRPNVNGPGLSS
jgi:hypothetical protein